MDDTVDNIYTVSEVAASLRLDVKTVRRIFQNEPGVVVIAIPRKGRRTYRTIRIPRTVLQRVLARFTR